MLRKFNLTKTIYNEKNNIWRGMDVDDVYTSNCSIGSILFDILLKYPEHITQICYHNGKEYTNREFATLSIRIAQNLQKMQLRQGDIIGICGSNSDYIAPLVFGALASGLIISTLDPSFNKDGIKHIYSITKPKIMFCDGSIYYLVKDSFEEENLTKTIYTIKDHIYGVPGLHELIEPTGIENKFIVPKLNNGINEIAMILCSSGTTGLPKGVCISHKSLLNTRLPDENNNKLLCFSSLYWLSGVVCLIGGTINRITRVIIDKPFMTKDFFDIVKRFEVNFVCSPPSEMAMCIASPKLIESDLSSVKLYICIGSQLSYSLLCKFKNYIRNAKFMVGYGLTEVGGCVAYKEVDVKGGVGQLLPNTEIKVIDDNNISLGIEQRGEICIRTKIPWAGYYGNPFATSKIYDKDNWIHTGDLGYVDNNGNVYIVDRKKDIMKYNNFHFCPTEIENVISEIPEVAEVCVFGIPDIISTYLPSAAVVKIKNSNLSTQQIIQYVANRMPHFKQLHGGVYFLDNLPKTASGKYLRHIIMDICIKLPIRTEELNS